MSHLTVGRRDVRRAALLQRLDEARPRIVAFVAPAGYGKSTLARQYSDGVSTGVCNCSVPQAVTQLARHVLAALAGKEAARVAFLAQCEMQTTLGDIAAVDLAAQAWRQPCERSIFIFENAEHLAKIDGGVGLLSKLLGVLPRERQVVICSREPLTLRLSRYVEPYEIVFLAAQDLRLSESEFEELFEPRLSKDLVARVFAISSGWPMVAALLARLWREGELERLIERLDDVAFDELHQYVVEEALGALTPAALDVLGTAVLIPEPTVEDLTLACGAVESANLQHYAQTSPFVRYERGTFDVHPLISAALFKRYGHRRDVALRNLASRHEASDSFIRAAELYLAAGEQHDAARVLEAISWLDAPTPSIKLAHLVASLDRDVLMRYPQLWGLAIAFSRFSIDPVTAIGEARTVLQRLADLPNDRLMHVVRPLAGYLSRLGLHEEGYRLICDFERAVGVPEIPRSINEAAILYIRMMIAARLGKLSESLALAERVRPFALRHDGMASLYLIEYAAETLRALGRYDEERRTLAQALERSRNGGYAVNAGLAIAEQSFGAWLAGNDELFDNCIADLEACVESDGVRGFWHYAAVARGNRDLPALGLELPKWIVCARIIAACSANDTNEAVHHAAAAHEAAGIYGSPFLKLLAALAYAEVAPQLRSERLSEAFETAQLIESSPLRKAVEAYVAGDADTGMLAPFVARLRRDVRDRPPSCDVLLLRGEVVVDRKRTELSDRKLGVIAALAQSPHGSSRETIAEKVWPEHEESSAVNAFNMCLHQLRKLLGENSIILRGDRYSFGDRVRLDVRQIQEYLAAIALRKELTDSQSAVLRRYYDRLCEPLPERYASWDWFDATERRIAELRCEIAGRLAREALANGEQGQALVLARKILEYDACDEPAREIAIRAYVAAGDEASAFREYRRYREVLWNELQAVPSLSIETILSESR